MPDLPPEALRDASCDLAALSEDWNGYAWSAELTDKIVHTVWAAVAPHLARQDRNPRGTSTPDGLRDLLARTIRDRVRLTIGPRAEQTLKEGNPVILSGREAGDAADAALAVRDEEMAALRERAEKAEAELETARAAVLDYENTITWFTTCKGCAATLDSSYAETVRAEKAEEALHSSRTALDRVVALARSLADTDPAAADLIAETVVNMPGECAPGAALAALDPPPESR
jgi:hypothetical protein